MSDFNPVTLYFILHESMGLWLWLLLGLALVLLGGIAVAAIRLRRAGQTVARPVIVAVTAGLIVTAVATFAVPAWTLAEVGALGAFVDYAFAVLLALVPGAIAASVVFMLAATRCARRGAAASREAQAAVRA